MNRMLFAGIVVLMGVSVGAVEEKGTKYGVGVSQEKAVKVADLLAAPDTYVGKTVRVDGVIQAVCQNMGCWIQIGDDAESKGIQFKVDDGVIVFPKDGKGRKASAEGVFEKIGAAGEAEHAAHAEHAKDAKPEAQKDPKDAEPPAYRIKATGAIIY